MPAATREAPLVARERELALLQGFFTSESPPLAIVLSGSPGIGKTTLWEAGIEAASERAALALSCRPAETDAQLSFAALADLLRPVPREALSTLPAPQLRALEVALLWAEPAGRPLDPRAVSAAFLNVVRGLAAERPVLVAVDDVQWLDRASADALAFAARRLEETAVTFLLAQREGTASTLRGALERTRVERIEIGPLSLGATARLLSDRLGLSLPRRVTQQVFELSGGNPLFSLEVGRVLAEQGWPEIGVDLPVPQMVEDLVGDRVAGLESRLRRALLAVALHPSLTTAQLARIVDRAALEEAVDAGLLEVEADRVRAAHPLLATAARSKAAAAERRALHLELAGAVADPPLSARHLALASTAPDEGVAGVVSLAARDAAARGAAVDAAELGAHALRLTPPESEERAERVLALAQYLLVAGEQKRAKELLVSELHGLPPGPTRARAHLLLAEGRWTALDIGQVLDQLDEALEESQGDPALRVSILARKARDAAVGRLEQVREAEDWALEALTLGRSVGPAAEREALQGLAWPRVLRGRPIDDLLERFRVVSGDAIELFLSLERVAGERHAHRGEIQEARSVLTRLLASADERGEYWSYAWIRMGLCEVELRAGEWDAAGLLLDDWRQSMDAFVEPAYARCRALLTAGRGLPGETDSWVEQADVELERSSRWHLFEVRRARGTVALFRGEADRAADELSHIWEHTHREGIEDPGVFPVAPDLVEALVELGRLDEASSVTERLGLLAEEQQHPWGLATWKRCRGLLHFASGGDRDEARALLLEAADAHGRLGLRFDRARSLLALGRFERRLRRWASARRSLEQAAEAFDEIGSTGWAVQARAELGRLGGRRPGRAGKLTPAERRVAELAADGLANKEIAQALFVSVYTVEEHLSHTYAKLGIRSRSQLARRLSARG